MEGRGLGRRGCAGGKSFPLVLLQRRMGQAVTAAAALVAVAVAAAVTETSASAPRPFPAPTNDSLGGFHLLASLQCDTASPGLVNGKRGFVDERNTIISVDPDVCWSPVPRPNVRSSRAGGRDEAVGTMVHCTPADESAKLRRLEALRNNDPTGSFVRDVEFTPLREEEGAGRGGQGGGGRRGHQLYQEDSVVRLLTLQRNSIAGAVHRFVGVYDVLALSRVTVGFCRTKECSGMFAVPVTGTFYADYYNNTHVPLLMHVDQQGRTMPVTMLDEDLLSLGRAAVADPAWLAPATDAWAFRVGFTLQARTIVEAAGHPRRTWNPLGPTWSHINSWDMSAASALATKAKTAKWLQAVAYVWCRAPMSSFVRSDRVALCGPEGDDAYPSASEAGTSVRHYHVAEWTFDPDQQSNDRPNKTLKRNDTDAPLPSCSFSVDKNNKDGQELARPAWLRCRSDREINPASAAEVALANSFSACAQQVRDNGKKWQNLRRIKYSSTSKYAGVHRTAEKLSQTYDRSVFGVEPPEEPATTNDLTLAIIVLVPEIIALLVLLLTTKKWRKVDLAALGLIFMAGLVSAAAIVSLAITEVNGSRWRAASLRDEWSVRVGSNGGGTSVFRPLQGKPLYRVETLYVTARLGYRVKLLVSLAGASTGAYLLLSIAVGMTVVRRWRRTTLKCQAAAGSDGEDEKPSPPLMPQKLRSWPVRGLGGGLERRLSPTVVLDVDALVRSPSAGSRNGSPRTLGP